MSPRQRSDIKHPEVTQIYLRYPRVFLPQTVLAEVAYLVGRDSGILTVVAFLRGISASHFQLVALLTLNVQLKF
jgi:hypothetical protein